MDIDRHLYDAIINGDSLSLSRLIGTGINIDAADDKGETALMKAVDDGNADIVKSLVAAGAHVDLQNHDGLA